MVTLMFSGCLLLADSTESTKETLTDKAQTSIIEYNTNQFRGKFEYEAYYFSKLYQHSPPEIKKLENLFEQKDKLPSKRREYSRKEYENKEAELDSLIDITKYKIKRNNINSKYSMEHIFMLYKGNIEGENYEERVVEARYFLNHKLDSIVDIKAGMNVSVPKELSGTFETFFFEDPLHRSDDYNADRNSDESFYLFFKERLAQYDEATEKSDFLLHALYITKLTDINKKYVPEQFGLLLANQIIKDTYKNNYEKTLRTSQMNGLYNKDEELIGYEIFVEAQLNNQQNKQVCFYINYNPWLEIVKFEQVAPPYEEYLN